MNELPNQRARTGPALATLCRRLPWLCCVAASSVAAQPIDPSCGNPFQHKYGPFDYRTDQGPNRRVVEDNHFTPQVEMLISGLTAPLGGDIDFTLRAFPNHHRALVSMMNLGVRVKSSQPQGAQYTVECYFKRALMFRPDDQVARMLYAKFLATSGRKAEALRNLEYTAEKVTDNPLTHYNIGLLLLEMGEFEKAVTQAHLAQKLGFEGRQLREKLQAAGKWSEPAVPSPASAASAASAPADGGS